MIYEARRRTAALWDVGDGRRGGRFVPADVAACAYPGVDRVRDRGVRAGLVDAHKDRALSLIHISERLPLPAEAVRALEARGACPIRTAWAVVVPTNECESVRQELQRHSLCVDWRVEGTHCVAGAASATSTYRVPDANVSAHLAPLLRRAESDSVSVPYARKIRVVFSLLQEDASVGRALHGWDLTHALHNISAYEALAPLARTVRALERVYDIQLESQVQWYAPLELEPQRHGAGQDAFYTVSMQDARVFVNAEQWRVVRSRRSAASCVS